MEKIIVSELKKEDITEAAKIIEQVENMHLSERTDIFLEKKTDWKIALENMMNEDDSVIIVAKERNIICGVCEAVIKHCGDNIETHVRDILFIEYIGVKEEYRRNNVGTMLLNEIKSIAKSKNITTLELNVWGFNTEAVKFYENNGMKVKRTIYEYNIDKE